MEVNELNQEERELLRYLQQSFKPVELKAAKEMLSVDEWIDSYYHCGSISETLYPFWRNELSSIFSGNLLKYNEIISTGSLSTGKSFFAMAVWLRLLYMFSMTPNLQKRLGFDPYTRIVFAYLSVSQKEAELTGFGDLRAHIDHIPYFNEVYTRNKDKDSVLEFPNGVTIVSGSDAMHFIGTTLFSLIFDETNFVRRGGGNPGDVKKAFEIYHASRMRIKTRMGGNKSPWAGLNVLVSSATHQTSFTEQAIELAKNDKMSKTILSRVYDVKPEAFSTKKFLFFKGNELVNPSVMQKIEDFAMVMSGDTMSKMPPLENATEFYDKLSPGIKDLFALVPVDFLDECEKFPDRAVTDIVGHSAAAKNSFFTSRSAFNACVSWGTSLGCKSPFSKDIISVGVRDNRQILDYFDMDYYLNRVKGHSVFLSIDQSTSHDPTGIAGCHAEVTPGAVKIVLDFMIRVVPPGGDDQISIGKCRKFLENLVDAGADVKLVTYDSYASAQALQQLQARNINAASFSTVANDECWNVVAELMLGTKLAMYEYPPFREEWFSLVHDRVLRKVDHPDDGMKDVSDAVVSCVFHAYMNASGASGGAMDYDCMNKVLVGMSSDKPNLENKQILIRDFFQGAINRPKRKEGGPGMLYY